MASIIDVYLTNINCQLEGPVFLTIRLCLRHLLYAPACLFSATYSESTAHTGRLFPTSSKHARLTRALISTMINYISTIPALI